MGATPPFDSPFDDPQGTSHAAPCTAAVGTSDADPCGTDCASTPPLAVLAAENAMLARTLGAAQRRCSRVIQDQARRIEVLEAQLVRLRAELIRRDSLIATLTARDCGTPALRAVAPSAAPLRDRSVLCVGRHSAAVPLYRHTVEQTGARFLHHDSGRDDDERSLDRSLGLADIVICQTGCLSHAAHWRVEDHCRRFGKRCVFVETPSRNRLRQALESVARDNAAPPPAGTALDRGARHDAAPAATSGPPR